MSRPDFLSFIFSLFTDGAAAFDGLDDLARVSDSSKYVRDVTDGLDQANADLKGALDVVVHPIKTILNDADLKADWIWFKTILANTLTFLILAFVVLFALYFIT